MVDATTAAVSRMQPAAVIQLRPGWGERKNTSAGFDVWLSSMSANHASHWAELGLDLGQQPDDVVAGQPDAGRRAAHRRAASSMPTSASRRLKAL